MAPRFYPLCRGGAVRPVEPEEILLADMDAWWDFADANREALVSQYGSIWKALKHARDGGLEMGGGAAPLVVVYFADGEAV